MTNLPYQVFEDSLFVAAFLSHTDANNYIDMRCDSIRLGTSIKLFFKGNQIGGFNADGTEWLA